MTTNKEGKKIIREFGPTTLSLKNKSTVFLITIMLIVFGIISYNTMSIETFPEVQFAYVFVKTVYPGNSPVEMENLITRPLEKEIHVVSGIKELRSTSSQDNSDIYVEFNPDADIKEALQDVKDAVDQAKSELPNDLPMDPIVMDIDVNEFPILNINLSGDFSIEELKKHAEYLEDEIEDVMEISKVEIKGLNAREIQINVDPHKLESFELTFYDIENAIYMENISISGGDLKIDGTTRSIRTAGEFVSMKEIEDIVIKNENNKIVYLKDVATVVDGFEDPLSMARLDREPVVSLQVIKKSGENLVDATDKIFAILAKAKADRVLPEELSLVITNDQSDFVKKLVSSLENSILMGMIFVILVLFFFLGLRNGLFVGMAIPMSMFMSIVILDLMGSTINMMVLFGLVLALGMLVDNAIVVVENTYRFVHQGYKLFDAVKHAVGEIAMPIIASTATTLAAFFPIVFWPGMMGGFMKYLPITLIVVLSSSLFVALIIIPVLARTFVKKDEELKAPDRKKTLRRSFWMLGTAVILHVLNMVGPASVMQALKIPILANSLILLTLLILLNLFFLHRAAEWFQKVFLCKLEDFYSKVIKKSLSGKMPRNILLGTVGLFIVVMMFFGFQVGVTKAVQVELFPDNEPAFFNVIADLPVGSDISTTDDLIQKIENEIFTLIEPHKHLVKSVMVTIGQGAVGENEMTMPGNTPNRGLVTVHFVDYEDREGLKTSGIMKQLSDRIIGKYPGVEISIDKNAMGPPTGKPINLEIVGKDFDRLIILADEIQQYLEEKDVPGIENLKMDLDTGMPEMLIHINREKARRFGLSTAQIASTIRTALFGKEISDYKEGEDEYPIWLRLDRKYRNNVSSLLDQKITFRNQTNGQIMQVPISAVADFSNSTTYGAVMRKDMERVITLFSNVETGFNAQDINNKLKQYMREYPMPEGYDYKFTGEQEDMEETMDFLLQALIIAVASIMIILVTQFNSFAKPGIIIASVFFSTIGVFGGLALFGMNFIVVMTGIGIISLAGVVVNNAIVLIDYIDYLKGLRRAELGLKEGDSLPLEESIQCIIRGGKTRLRPVLLTAITTILGLLPMASGLNINFGTLLTRFNPQIYFGGDNAAFWGPMAWTVIFGLTFATFLTLVLVPAMYLMGERIKSNGFSPRKLISSPVETIRETVLNGKKKS